MLFTARIERFSSFSMILPSSLALSLGTAPVLVPLRPSMETLLIFHLLQGGGQTVLHCAHLSHPIFLSRVA